MSELNTQQMQRALTVLRRLPPRERLRVIAQALPEAERELASPMSAPGEADAVSLAAAEARFQQQLVDMGLLVEIPTPLAAHERQLPALLEVPGTPLSEIIIAERR